MLYKVSTKHFFVRISSVKFFFDYQLFFFLLLFGNLWNLFSLFLSHPKNIENNSKTYIKYIPKINLSVVIFSFFLCWQSWVIFKVPLAWRYTFFWFNLMMVLQFITYDINDDDQQKVEENTLNIMFQWNTFLYSCGSITWDEK